MTINNGQPDIAPASSYDLAAERSVLGAMLLHPSAVRSVSFLASDDFFLVRHAVVHSAIVSVHAKTGQSDPVSVANEIKSSRNPTALEGSSSDAVMQLMDLAEEVLTPAGVEHHARIVQQKARVRRLMSHMQESMLRLQRGDDVEEVSTGLVSSVRSGLVLPEGLAAASTLLPEGSLSKRPPLRDYLLRLSTRDGLDVPPLADGDGFLPSGVSGFLSSEGGVGKTQLVLSLAVAIVTGREWLGFRVARQRQGQPVYLVLAEETREEVQRRMFHLAEFLRLSDKERREVEHLVTIAAMAGRPCALVSGEEDGHKRTANYMSLRDKLEQSKDPWALVVLDPLARMFPEAESRNDLATAAVQTSESLCEVPGQPFVLNNHHSSKLARRTDTVDARGVTALTDGARWASTLQSGKKGQVIFAVTKNNYGPPVDPVTLVREPGGLLRRASAAELATRADLEGEAQEAKVLADATAIIEAVKKHAEKGETTARTDVLSTWAGMRATRGRLAVAYALSAGTLIQVGYRGPYAVPGAPLDAGEAVGSEQKANDQADGGESGGESVGAGRSLWPPSEEPEF